MTKSAENKFDNELIARSVSGDRAARERLATVCMPRVWRTVYLACRGGDEVEDLVQESMIRAFADLSGFRATGNFFAWLDRVTVNVMKQHFRKRSLKMFIPSDKLDTRQSLDTGLDNKFEGKRVMDRLAHHLSGIRPKNRMAVILSIVQGYTVSEIALAADCSVETAKKRLLRGRRELVSRVQKDPYSRQILKELRI